MERSRCFVTASPVDATRQAANALSELLRKIATRLDDVVESLGASSNGLVKEADHWEVIDGPLGPIQHGAT